LFYTYKEVTMSITIQNVGNDLLNTLWLIQSQNQTYAAAGSNATAPSTVTLTPQQQSQLDYNKSLLQTTNSGNQDSFSLTSSLLQKILDNAAAAAPGSGSSAAGATTHMTPEEQTQVSYNANLMQMLNPGTQENSGLQATLLQNQIDFYR
jgi:hypothetical protein